MLLFALEGDIIFSILDGKRLLFDMEGGTILSNALTNLPVLGGEKILSLFSKAVCYTTTLKKIV